MTERWSARGGISLDVLERVQGSLTVDMIMTPRADLMTCCQNETISAVMERNREGYSYLPVVDDDQRFIGLFDASAWFKLQAPDEAIADGFVPFSEALVIGADASIFEFVVHADTQPTRLVVSGHKVAGLISISDLQQLPVRAALFTLITSLEIAMAKRIAVEWTDNPIGWMAHLSEPRRGAVKEKTAKARMADRFVNEIVLTEFCDKATIVRKANLVTGSKRHLKEKFNDIRDLRDNLAHANFYAETPEAASNVCAVVRSILDIKRTLITGIEEKQRTGREAAADHLFLASTEEASVTAVPTDDLTPAVHVEKVIEGVAHQCLPESS